MPGLVESRFVCRISDSPQPLCRGRPQFLVLCGQFLRFGHHRDRRQCRALRLVVARAGHDAPQHGQRIGAAQDAGGFDRSRLHAVVEIAQQVSNLRARLRIADLPHGRERFVHDVVVLRPQRVYQVRQRGIAPQNPDRAASIGTRIEA